MVANVVAFGVGFAVFVIAFGVLATYVVRFANRVGRRTVERDLPPRPGQQDGPGSSESS